MELVRKYILKVAINVLSQNSRIIYFLQYQKLK